jgi:hypothetical protein
MQRRARQEESVSTQRLTPLTELFEIPHLTNRSAYCVSASRNVFRYRYTYPNAQAATRADTNHL